MSNVEYFMTFEWETMKIFWHPTCHIKWRVQNYEEARRTGYDYVWHSVLFEQYSSLFDKVHWCSSCQPSNPTHHSVSSSLYWFVSLYYVFVQGKGLRSRKWSSVFFRLYGEAKQGPIVTGIEITRSTTDLGLWCKLCFFSVENAWF